MAAQRKAKMHRLSERVLKNSKTDMMTHSKQMVAQPDQNLEKETHIQLAGYHQQKKVKQM